jgi:hypothetical protein
MECSAPVRLIGRKESLLLETKGKAEKATEQLVRFSGAGLAAAN